MEMSTILIVDDERLLREAMKALLVGEGFDVRLARDGEECLRKIEQDTPDLVLLDVMMPKMNGFRTCEEIRKRDALLPVVFLTAKDSESDQIRAIGLGGDDYISKTASETVLIARIRRALQRAEAFDAGSGDIRLGTIRVDLEALAVLTGTGKVALTKTEGDMLRLLAREPGRFVSKENLIVGLRGRGYACGDTMIYSHIFNLRLKLGKEGRRLVCDRRSGYKLEIES